MSEPTFQLEEKRPWALRIAEALRKAKDYDPLGLGQKDAAVNFLIGDKDKLFERVGYGLPMTEGKVAGAASLPALVREAGEIPDVIPTGVGKMGAIGIRGIKNLGDSALAKQAETLSALLRKTNSKDWQTQKEIIESTPGFFPVPRGRDYTGGRHAKFGYEMPEGKLTPGMEEMDLAGRDPWSGMLTDVYHHPRLYKAYPELQDYTVRYEPKASMGSGYIKHPDREIGIGPHDSTSSALKTMNHEVAGHATQRFEGWPQGSNVKYAKGQLLDIPENLPPEQLPKDMRRVHDLALLLRSEKFPGVEKTAASAAYRREAGEQLAEAIARSAKQGGGKIRENYTTLFSKMYDRRALDAAIQDMRNKELAEYFRKIQEK